MGCNVLERTLLLVVCICAVGRMLGEHAVEAQTQTAPRSSELIAFTNGRAGWALDAGTAEAVLASEIVANGKVIYRSLAGAYRYDYWDVHPWSLLTSPTERRVYLTLPVSRFELGLQEIHSKTSVAAMLAARHEAVSHSPAWSLSTTTAPPEIGPNGWTGGSCPAEVYGWRGKPDARPALRQALQQQLPPGAAAVLPPLAPGGEPASEPIEQTFWVSGSQQTRVLAARTTRADLTVSVDGLTRWLPGDMTAPAPPTGNGRDICMVVLSSLDSWFNVGMRPDRRLWSDYDVHKIVSTTDGDSTFERIAHQLPPSLLGGPATVDKADLLRNGIQTLYLPRSLPSRWRLIDAVASPSTNPMRADYAWEGTTPSVCITFGLDQTPQTTMLLLERLARPGDPVRWVADRETLTLGKLKVGLTRLSGAMGGVYIRLLGHNCSASDLSTVRERLVPVSAR